MNHILIEGFMGSGKGTVGKRLATEMGLPLIDVDKKVAERMRMTSGEIYDRFGDVYYRALETFVLTELLEEKDRSVILLGSGLPLMPQNHSYLRDLGTVYYLKADENVIFAKLERSKKRDWLAENDDVRERASKMLEEREPAYSACADHVIETGRRRSADIVAEIMRIDAGKNGVPAPAEEQQEEAPAEEKAPAKEKAAEAPAEEKAPAVKKPAKKASKKKAKKEEKTAPAEETPAEETPVKEIPAVAEAAAEKPVKKAAKAVKKAVKKAAKKAAEKEDPAE